MSDREFPEWSGRYPRTYECYLHLLAVEVDGLDLVLRCSYCEPEWRQTFDGDAGVLVGTLMRIATEHHQSQHVGAAGPVYEGMVPCAVCGTLGDPTKMYQMSHSSDPTTMLYVEVGCFTDEGKARLIRERYPAVDATLIWTANG